MSRSAFGAAHENPATRGNQPQRRERREGRDRNLRRIDIAAQTIDAAIQLGQHPCTNGKTPVPQASARSRALR